MTILKKFDENGQEISSEDVFVTDTNLPRAIEQYGTDWAKGYAAAYADIMKQIDTTVLNRYDEDGEPWCVSDQVAGRRIEKFHKEKSLILERMVPLLSDPKLKP